MPTNPMKPLRVPPQGPAKERITPDDQGTQRGKHHQMAPKPALKVPPKPPRPTGVTRTQSITHPGEGYDLPKMHTSKHR